MVNTQHKKIHNAIYLIYCILFQIASTIKM